MAQLLALENNPGRPLLLPQTVRDLDVFGSPGVSGQSPSDAQGVHFLNDQQIKAWLCETTTQHNSMLDIDSEPATSRLTHIICTIGPASREVDVLVKLMKEGMNICRLNFSHGTYEYHAETVKNIQAALAQMPPGTVVATALDTKGPEIRTGLVEGGSSAEVHLETGQTIVVTTNNAYKEKCSAEVLWVDYPNIVESLEIGGLIYVDDGLISLTVAEKSFDSVTCLVVNGGALGSKKGVNLPEVNVDLPAVSEKDTQDLLFGLEQKIDMVFASFIQDASGIKQIRQVLGDQGAHIKIIAKIESFAGIRNFAEIISECDGAMVARGDMGIEIPPQKVFLAQKMMISACNRACKPVICATQMLESMTYKPRATRAESNDVANAVLDGADCVMLSGESAKGLYPVEAVKHMSDVCLEAESAYQSLSFFKEIKSLVPTCSDFSRSIAVAAVSASYQSLASAIIVLASKPCTVQYLANFRPRCPIVFVTRVMSLARQALLYRAVTPHVVTTPPLAEWDADVSMRIEAGIKHGVTAGFINRFDSLVLVLTLTSEKGKHCSVQVVTHDY
ncbi:pyruvate kinase [Elysia marginata]|uniref:Pyruvate kinase n=1 Tax=Elysia marginata TaxID=1093978 RepID=A0AAV4EUC5_9GAST|nr:pyruvate kinase [Elysia marginata]